MSKLLELRATRSAKNDRLIAILQKQVDESRNATEAETKEYNDLDAEIRAIDVMITNAEKLDELKTKQADDQRSVNANDNPLNFTNIKTVNEDLSKEFKSFGEFIQSALLNPRDRRLNYQEVEQRDHQMGDGAKGGFLVPKQFIDTLKQVEPGAAIFRPRATVIPAGSPPDAEVTMPVLDQTSAQNMYGGMTVTWIAEGGTKNEGNVRFREISLTPKEVAGYVTVTDKLLRNAPAMSGILQTMIKGAITGAEETAFLTGNGVGKPLGITNSPARIGVARNGANAIAWVDIRTMYARLKMGGSPVWIASQTVLPQLMTIADPGTNGAMIWQPNAREGAPATLLGIPVLFADRCPALGTAGDLMLVDLSYYLIKDGSGPFIATDGGIVNFTSNKTLIKVFWNVDGQPWLNAPIPLEGATSNTVSPFVTLNA